MSGGSAWKKNHEEILAHARGLHYDHVPGVSLPDADASRETWTTSMNAFNDWKAREVAKEASGQAWWQTYKGGDGGGGEGGGGGGGGTGSPDWDNPDPGTGTGPYPDPNIYFPMLVPEYNDPQAQDWSRWMPRGQQGANVRPGDIWGGGPDLSGGGGLLYQPWSQEYGEQFVQPNIWDYQPPQLKVGRPQYYQNPLGIMDVIMPESGGSGKNEDEYDPNKDPGWDEGGGGADDPNMASDMVDVNGAKVPRGFTIYNGKITTFADAERAKQAAAAEAAVDAVVDTGIGLGLGFPSDY
jgi:hypothetical protein